MASHCELLLLTEAEKRIQFDCIIVAKEITKDSDNKFVVVVIKHNFRQSKRTKRTKQSTRYASDLRELSNHDIIRVFVATKSQGKDSDLGTVTNILLFYCSTSNFFCRSFFSERTQKPN